MNCKLCGNPLRVIKGGLKSDVGTNKITMVHVWGCLNDKCELNMQEQKRTETEQESFEG